MDRDRIVRVIEASLVGKYSQLSSAALEELVAAALDRAERFADAGETVLMLSGSPTVDFASDLNNQARCYVLIERFWRKRQPGPGFIRSLHASIMGKTVEQCELRNTESVPDYPGVLPTPVDEVADGLLLVDQRLCTAIEYRGQAEREKAHYLADVFALIIRVHPFRDGNGRTARVAVQFCLRLWGYDYMVLPKVRNDEGWKNALSAAIDGAYEPLADYFRLRIPA